MEYRQDRELEENFKLVEVGSGLKQEFMGLRSRSKVWIGTWGYRLQDSNVSRICRSYDQEWDLERCRSLKTSGW